MGLSRNILTMSRDRFSRDSSRPAPEVSVKPGQSRELRYFLAVLVGLSVVAASIENGLSPFFSLPFLPLIFAAILRADYARPFLFSERIVAMLIPVYVISFVVVIKLLTGTMLLPVFMVYFTFGVLVARTLTPLSDRNLAQLIFLSLGMILVNCILTSHLLFGLLVPVYFFCLMGTLLLFHLARNKTRSGEVVSLRDRKSTGPHWYGKFVKYTFAVLVLTIIVFVFIPRPFLVFPGLRGPFSPAGAFGDLQSRITYRDMVNTADRNRIAFMVNLQKGSLPNSPYWRGRVLDKNDSRGWHSTVDYKPMAWLIHPELSETVIYEILLYRLQSKMVYVAGLPLMVTGRMNRPLFVSSGGQVTVNSPFLFSDSYRVKAVDRPVPADRRAEAVYLDRTGVTPRIEKLAQQWTSGVANPRDKAGVLVSRLRSQLRYKLRTPPPPAEANPMEYFLFESKTGNCEYFAGALCLMLRSVGIPARIVEGFAGMENTSEPNQFVVRFSSAHAWVEALLDNANWTTLDPTPEMRGESPEDYIWRLLADLYSAAEYGWVKHVVYFDRSDQMLMFQRLADLFSGDSGLAFSISGRLGQVLASVGVAATIFVLAFLLIVKRRKAARPSTVYFRTMKTLAEKGILKRIHPWQEQNMREAIQRFPVVTEPLLKFMDLYWKARFDPRHSVPVKVLESARLELLQQINSAAFPNKM